MDGKRYPISSELDLNSSNKQLIDAMSILCLEMTQHYTLWEFLPCS